MNTFGKILVVCVFLMSLAAAGLCVFVYITSSNWKKYADYSNERATASQLNNDPLAKSNAFLREQLKQAENAKNTADEKNKEDTAKFNAIISGKDEKIDELHTINMELKLSKDKLLLDYQRTQEEFTATRKILEEREKSVVELSTLITKLNQDLQGKDNQISDRDNRNKLLLDRVVKLEEAIAKWESSKSDTPRIARDPNQLNPPPTHVKGLISRIDLKDKNYVLLDIGSDHGVNRNNTLDVYRLQPQPKWLGNVRIVETYPQSSVGRMMRSQSTSPLKEGDIVESPLLP